MLSYRESPLPRRPVAREAQALNNSSSDGGWEPRLSAEARICDVLGFHSEMAVYRYSPGSIDSLSRRIRLHHAAGFLIIIAGVCAATLALSELRAALIYDTIFTLAMAIIFVRGQSRALQRIATLLRATEIEIDDEKASWRSNLSKTVLYRAEIVEACISKRGIWLRSKSRRKPLQIPPEIEDFDKLLPFLEEWLPQHVMRRDSPPSSVWPYLKLYGIWAGAALLLYTAMVNKTPAIAIPACLLGATGFGWYFAWCGRKIDERKWKVLLPLSGYFLAAALVGRAVTLWLSR